MRILLLLLFSINAYAHESSNSYLQINMQQQYITATWDIAVLDLENILGLDNNLDSKITWAEIKAQKSVINNYARNQLIVKTPEKLCNLHITDLLINKLNSKPYAHLKFSSDCSSKTTELSINYNLFFQRNVLHRGFLTIENKNQYNYMFSPEQNNFTINFQENNLFKQFINYCQQGIWHIWIGFDHILFLLNLLLPAVFLYNNFKLALKDVIVIVTAFTIAHSITLALAIFNIINFPSKWVEITIALSIFLVALNNLFPVFTKYRWLLTFIFGLIHGFGFASVLLGLNFNNLIISLFAFNIGVELGQLIIVSLFFPIIYLLRNSWLYKILIFKIGSIASAILAIIWMFERFI